MRTKDIVIGLGVLIILITFALVIKKSINKKTVENIPQQISTTEKIKNTFNGLEVPKGTQKADLTDTAGGESYGIVTNSEVLANLPDIKIGEHYQVMLIRDDKLTQIGNMRIAKGGWILEHDFTNLTGYKIVISLNGGEVLEGSF